MDDGGSRDGTPSRIYVDTNVFIYFLEFDNDLGNAARKWIGDIRKKQSEIVISRLVFLECIYQPSRSGNHALIDLYRSMLTKTAAIALAEMTPVILEDSALNGGKLGLKLSDAIHFMTALHMGCDLFLTNDRRFKSTPGLRVAYLSAEH